jgi:uncharacterized protein YjbI with pentapeptide repeats
MLKWLRSWWKNTSKTLDVVVILMLVVLLAVIMVSILGYAYNLNWSGLHSKTFWDWLQLLIIPAVLAVGGYLFNYTTSRNEQKTTRLRDKNERDIALDNQREAALQAYIDSMSELLLEKKLRESGENDEVRNIARVRTLTVLPRLDGQRKRSVLQFLYESGLIDKDKKIIDLRAANLYEAKLNFAELHRANLSGANLHEANLFRANLHEADLNGADLFGAKLNYANLHGANLGRANLSAANLSAANLSAANLSAAFLGGVFSGGTGAADPSGANLVFANLHEAILSGADPLGVNLSGANLLGANVTTEQLKQTISLSGATMPDGTKHD